MGRMNTRVRVRESPETANPISFFCACETMRRTAIDDVTRLKLMIRNATITLLVRLICDVVNDAYRSATSRAAIRHQSMDGTRIASNIMWMRSRLPFALG